MLRDFDPNRPSFPELPVIDEDDAADSESEAPRVVLITGAAGRVGRLLRAAWADRYDVIAIDQIFNPGDPDLAIADLSTWDETWTELFDEADVVVHLAAHSNPEAPWADLAPANIDALANVLMAAAQAGIERVVFASSARVLMGANPADPRTTPIPLDDAGASKFVGERLGRCFAEAAGFAFVALRLGWVDLAQPPTGSASVPWIEGRHLTPLFTHAVETPLEPGEVRILPGFTHDPSGRFSPLDPVSIDPDRDAPAS